MGKKFSSNVATQIPKTKVMHEPHLPWNVTQNDLAGSQFEDSVHAAPIGKAPLGIKPLYLILIIVLIFLCALSVFFITVQSNEEIKVQIQRAEEERALLVDDLRNAANEASALKGKVEVLERNIIVLDAQNKNLTEQNRDFMTVIKRISEDEEGAPLINKDRKSIRFLGR